jgi:hypothetical protein
VTSNPLAKKLLIKPGFRGAVVNAPVGYLDLLCPLLEGAAVEEHLEDGLDFVLLFAADLAELRRHADKAVKSVRPRGLLWVGYRKGGQKAGTDLNRDLLWEAMSKHEMVGVSLVALDGTWSAMRFRPEADVGS